MATPDLNKTLDRVPFLVLDLETTGGSPHTCAITEVGAVRVEGGEVVAELQTLVRPGQPIPRPVTALTGITDGLVADRPPLDAVLPSLLEMARGAVLVAHNARFDIGFLNRALERRGDPPLTHPTICTAALARRLLDEEVADRRLATLAAHLRTATAPTHRALADARATVEVFHTLLERAGSHGVLTLRDLLEFVRARNVGAFTARRHLAADLPHAPGVYRFVAASGEVLYVGRANDLARRVRQYFGSDPRRRIAELVRQTARIEHRVLPTPLEAAVAEHRDLRRLRPHFNRRLPRRHAVYVKLTVERFPRLSITIREPRDTAAFLGPLGSRRVAQRVVDALHDALPLRRCTPRIGPRTTFPACALAEIGRCSAPCEGRVHPRDYAPVVRQAASALGGDLRGVAPPLRRRLAALGASGRYEEAAEVRDRLAALAHGVLRARRTADLGRVDLLAASIPGADQRRDLLVIRRGWLAGSARCRPDEVRRTVAALADRSVPEGPTDPGEAVLLLAWLSQDGVRVHRCEGVWAWPVAGGRLLQELASLPR